MKMNNITQIDRDSILEMHSKMKKPLISEQVVTDLKSQLNKILTDGCVKNGKIVTMQTKNPALQFAIKQESTKTPGKFRYFFADGRAGIFDANGKFQFLPGKLDCTEVQQAAAQAVTAATQAANAADTALVQQEGGWAEAKDIKTTRENLENPQMFEKKVVNGVTLYRSVINKGVTGGLTPEQVKVIKKYTDLGGKLRKDLDAEEAQTWSSKVVYPAGTLFAEDLVMFFPPGNVVGSNRDEVTKDSSMGSKIEDEFKKASQNQTPTSKRDCKDTIESYYEAWRTKKRIEPNTLLPMKEKVQACANEFEGKWGGILSRIDNYVDILRGDKEGGPLSDSKWRIE
jgi:hypothetical protein